MNPIKIALVLPSKGAVVPAIVPVELDYFLLPNLTRPRRTPMDKHFVAHLDRSLL